MALRIGAFLLLLAVIFAGAYGVGFAVRSGAGPASPGMTMTGHR